MYKLPKINSLLNNLNEISKHLIQPSLKGAYHQWRYFLRKKIQKWLNRKSLSLPLSRHCNGPNARQCNGGDHVMWLSVWSWKLGAPRCCRSSRIALGTLSWWSLWVQLSLSASRLHLEKYLLKIFILWIEK